MGVPWRDLPADFGPWQTVWKRHRRFAGDGTWDVVLTALLSLADAAEVIDWSAVGSTRHRVGCISMARPWRATQGAPSNYTNLCDEPADHAVGRSRGGLTTKIHQLCDGRGLPLVVLIGAGHAHDSPMFDPLMGQLRVPRLGAGRVLAGSGAG